MPNKRDGDGVSRPPFTKTPANTNHRPGAPKAPVVNAPRNKGGRILVLPNRPTATLAPAIAVPEEKESPNE